jgi:uncharacterized repeat protein (TIGR01451 family)
MPDSTCTPGHQSYGGLPPQAALGHPSGTEQHVGLSALRWLVVVIIVVLPLAESGAGSNWDAKAAVHVLPHDSFRTCSRDLPEISGCGDISTTCDSCGSVDVFPVFFGLEEYLGVEYGLVWPGSASCTFTTCSDLHLGDISASGDGISQVWFSCKFAPAVVPGFGWIQLDQPAQICIVPHPKTGGLSILDCSEHLDEPVGIFCAGVCGSTGDDPCQTVFCPLNLLKSDEMDNSCVSGGDHIDYAISYDNADNLDDVHNVVLTDDLPAEAEFVSCSTPGTYDPGGHRVTWDLGTLAGAELGTAELRVRVDDVIEPGGSLENRCTITSDETSTTQVTRYTDVCPDMFEPLNLTKQDDTGGQCVYPGQTLAYSIAYDNTTNPYDLHEVVLVDSLPADVQYVSCSAGGDYQEIGHMVTWQVGTLGPGGSGQVQVLVEVDGTVAPADEICNRAEIVASETPATGVTDCTTVCTDVISVGLTKVGLIDSTCADRGDTVTYRIYYQNPNPFDLFGVCLVDYLPGETDFVSATSAGTYEASTHTVTWEIGSLSGSEDGGMEVLARVRADATPGITVSNRCEAVADGTVPSAAQVTVDICGLSTLNLAKSDGRGGQCASRGTGMTYVISYDNTTNSEDVHDVVLTDYLSGRLEFRSATDDGVYEASQHRVVWDLGTLPAGARDTVSLATRVRNTATPGSQILNRCTIAGTGTGITEASTTGRVCEEGSFEFKAAVHVLGHNQHRTCSGGMPAITSCRDIKTTSDSSSVDAFPVFFDFTEYLGVEYGLAWCDSGSCQTAIFTSCSDLVIGDIEQSGDGISQTWLSCRSGPALPGWAWISVTEPSTICLVPRPGSGSIYVLGCTENLGTPTCTFCAGVYGRTGDDPCEPTTIRPTTWGGIKAIFR